MVNDNQQMDEKEVKAEVGQEHSEVDKSLSFSELYEQSLQEVPLGEVVTGRIVQIGNDVIMVDVGYKTEGQIQASELRDEKGDLTVSVGDEIEVLIDRKDEEDNLILSREKAAKMKLWSDVKEAYDTQGVITGTVMSRVKGGFFVDIGMPAFLPGSQIDVRPVKDLDHYVGETLQFNVLSFDRKRSNVVLSRRSIMEKERNEEKKRVLETIEEGKIVEGTVKNITDYGIFVDLGGIDGLLHVTDISWGKITRPSDSFSKGDKITVKVLSFDRAKERVSLGLKQLKENPWDTIDEKYAVGSVVEGKVVSIMEYGAFVELEPGVEGLIHVSEMFWTSRKSKHPSKAVSVGEDVRVMILDVNKEKKRISLGLKQTTPNPWNAIKEKYPPGSIVKGVVRNITDFGVFVGLEEGIDGLVHVSDISWRRKVKHPSEFFKKGQEVEAVVLGVDVENEKFSLGIKQLERNPWDEITAKYPVGSSVSGPITNVTDFGVFVAIEEGIEGLVHISELSQKKVKSLAENFKVGDVVTASVKNVDTKSKKIRLSIREYENSLNETSGNQYMNNREKVGSNLGKVLAGVKLDV
ncbi:MAG TPA: 30S ribosomal protein S1 [Syntrophales bacterium]|nr:30S ribosomal protein S1 [Syntrophobacterales bacterium]HRT69941.1 30S ribosomal protein S1 [Syntrophales bacterium]